MALPLGCLPVAFMVIVTFVDTVCVLADHMGIQLFMFQLAFLS
jgi:hypothetical protein